MKCDLKNGKLKISVVTPNYNYSQYLDQCILSVIQQNYDNFEHIIVDDGSTDNSIEIIKKYQQMYPDKIKLVQQKNSGQTSAINRGLQEVTGDIICWINSDDFFYENTFNKINEIFLDKKDIDVVYGNVIVIDLNNNYIYKIRNMKYDPVFSAFFGICKSITSNAVFWKKELMNKVGLMDATLKVNMDGDFFSRLFRQSKPYFSNDTFAYFRKQSVSLAGKNDKNWKNLVKKERKLEINNSIDYLLKEKKYNKNIIYILKIISLLKRVILRFLFFHYQIRLLEKLIYRIYR